jgi:hypothetical protein
MCIEFHSPRTPPNAGEWRLPGLHRRKKLFFFFEKNVLVSEYQYEISDVDHVREHLVQREFR